MNFFRRHPIVGGIVGGFACLFLIIGVFIAWRVKGPYRFYRLNVLETAATKGIEAGVLEIGVAKRDITPDLSQYDPWQDVDGDNRYRPEKGDTYTDANGNGRFDAVWLAGFNNNRPAQGVHDPLWVRALAYRNNGVTGVMVAIDSIGITNERFIKVRKSLPTELRLDLVTFASTHVHEAPDTMGIWSYKIFGGYFDETYIERVQKACKEAIIEAVNKLEPAKMTIAAAKIEPEGFMDDSRLPHVYDDQICAAWFTKPGSGETIATLVSWGNHPETLGGSNPLITSDYPHFLREGVEKGVEDPNGAPGLGGTCVFFSGNLGGLMTQLHTTVPHRDGQREFEEASFEKAQALGENVAIEVLAALRGPRAIQSSSTEVKVAGRTFFVPLDGMFYWAIFAGVIHPGWYWGKGRTEVHAIQIGDLAILTSPGELYPEIAEGGVECPEGADYPGELVETPPLRQVMRGKVNMMFNLANDEIGYMIPKTQWDVKPPYAYGREKPQYGEENSGGPEVGPTYHRAAVELLQDLYNGAEQVAQNE
ncbi:MAG: hypothetical protein R6V12_06255 [Candidatus Hydrogenedentota bacterium]